MVGGLTVRLIGSLIIDLAMKQYHSRTLGSNGPTGSIGSVVVTDNVINVINKSKELLLVN
jgi:hypothetical protein